MTIPGFEIDLSQINAGLLKLQKAGTAAQERVLGKAAFGVIAKAQRRAPVRFGELINSARVDPVQNGTVRFGFDKSYADVMDRGWKVSVIKPKNGQFLVIPISRRAARRGSLTGNIAKLRQSTGGKSVSRARRRSGKRVQLRNAQGRFAGGFTTKRNRAKANRKQSEFVFALKVIPRKAQKGSRRGPNYYFSGTLRDVVNDGSLAQFIGNAIKKDLGT